MKLTTKYDVGDKVILDALGDTINATVISIWITDRGLKYELVFWNSGKREQEYFFDFEIKGKAQQ